MRLLKTTHRSLGHCYGNGKHLKRFNWLDGVLFTMHYITSAVWFGKVFAGAGLVLMGTGLLKWKVVDSWLSIFTIFLELTAMGILMLIPVNFEIYNLFSMWKLFCI